MNPPPRDPGTSAPTPTASDGRDAYAIAAWMLALGAVIVGAALLLGRPEPVAGKARAAEREAFLKATREAAAAKGAQP